MSDIAFGRIITGKQHRDAIHVAVVPTVAAEDLLPGQKVKLNKDKEAVGNQKNSVGLVDPWLSSTVKKGETFWLFVNPNTVTGMRHHWSHPVFDSDSPDVGVSKLFIMECARDAGIDYDEIMDAAHNYLHHGTYLCQGGRWEGFYLEDEFWDHYEVVTGQTVHKNDRGSFFTCSC